MAKQLKLSEAFSKRCVKEKEKLVKSLAEELVEAMQRLYEDMLDGLQIGGENLVPHKYIIKARCPLLYNAIEKFLRQPVVIPPDVMKDYQLILRHLYCKENITVVSFQIERLIQFFNEPGCNNVNQNQNLENQVNNMNDCQDAEDLLEIKENDQEQLNLDLHHKLKISCESIGCGPTQDTSISSNIQSITEGDSSVSIKDNTKKDDTLSAGTENKEELNNADQNTKFEMAHNNYNGHIPGSCDDVSEKDLKGKHEMNDLCHDQSKSTTQVEANADEESLTESVSVLGSDLLFIYQTGLDYDTVLVAQDIKFFAHRGILSVRSEYFSAMLGGAWAESSAEEIKLEGITPQVLEKMLFYIYGGYIENWSLELLAAGDMYGLTGLKQCMAHTLRKDKCHFFHKPCSECLTSFSEILAVSQMYGLEELFHRCLNWNTKYFDRLWQVKSFAQLPQELLDICLDSLLKEMNILNIIQIYMDAVKLIKALQNLKWGESVVSLAQVLIDNCVTLVSKNVMAVVTKQKKTISIAYEGMAEDSIDELFGRAVRLQTPQAGIATYSELDILCSKIDEFPESENWHDQYRGIYKHAKQFMITNVNSVVGLPEWSMKLNTNQQETLKIEAGFVSVGGDTVPRIPKPKLSDKHGMKFKPKHGKLSSGQNYESHFGARPKTTLKPHTTKNVKSNNKVSKIKAKSEDSLSNNKSEDSSIRNRNRRIKASNKGGENESLLNSSFESNNTTRYNPAESKKNLLLHSKCKNDVLSGKLDFEVQGTENLDLYLKEDGFVSNSYSRSAESLFSDGCGIEDRHIQFKANFVNELECTFMVPDQN